jgi:type III secretory pathway lipoprotein EscJ
VAHVHFVENMIGILARVRVGWQQSARQKAGNPAHYAVLTVHEPEIPRKSMLGNFASRLGRREIGSK